MGMSAGPGTRSLHLKSSLISPSKRSGQLDPGHELNPGLELSPGLELGAGHGPPGHRLTTRIAQLRRDVRPCSTEMVQA